MHERKSLWLKCDAIQLFISSLLLQDRVWFEVFCYSQSFSMKYLLAVVPQPDNEILHVKCHHQAIFNVSIILQNTIQRSWPSAVERNQYFCCYSTDQEWETVCPAPSLTQIYQAWAHLLFPTRQMLLYLFDIHIKHVALHEDWYLHTRGKQDYYRSQVPVFLMSSNSSISCQQHCCTARHRDAFLGSGLKKGRCKMDIARISARICWFAKKCKLPDASNGLIAGDTQSSQQSFDHIS